MKKKFKKESVWSSTIETHSPFIFRKYFNFKIQVKKPVI